MNKSFIDLTCMKDELLEMLKNEFLTKDHFNSDTIDVKLNLKDIIKQKMETNNVVEPTIYITVNAFQKMRHLVEQNTGEVAWHGLIEQANGVYIITDILVFPQVVTAATVVGIDNTYEMWIATQPDEIFDRLRMHGHSHVNFGVTPSGTDENYYNNLMTHVQDFYITLITNKKDEYHIRFYDKVNNIQYSNIELNICFEDGTLLDTWYDSVKGNITLPAPIAYAVPARDERKGSLLKEGEEDIETVTWYNNLKKNQEKKNMTTLKNSTTTHTTTKPYLPVYLQLPSNEMKTFSTLDYAVNYIYTFYAEQAPHINKNNMRRVLAKEHCLAFSPSTKNFLKSCKGKGVLEHAILHCDFWEVIQGDIK